MLSKLDAAMDRNDAGGEIEYVHLVQAGRLKHRGERVLVGMHANRFGEVAIGGAIADDALAQPWQHAERVKVIGGLERRPDLGKLEHHEAPAGTQHARHFRERGLFAGHVTKPKANGHAIEGASRKRQALGVALHRGHERARVYQAVAATLEHAPVDVGGPYLTARSDGAREGRSEIAAPGGDVEHALARTRTRDGDGEALPVAV